MAWARAVLYFSIFALYSHAGHSQRTDWTTYPSTTVGWTTYPPTTSPYPTTPGPTTPIPSCPTFKFLEPIYDGDYRNDNVTFPSIRISTPFFGNSTRVSLVGDDSQYFNATIDSRDFVNITLVRPIPINVQSSNLLFEVRARRDDLSAHAAILVRFPDSNATGNCFIEDVTEAQWSNELVINITDIDTGSTFRKAILDINGITNFISVQYPLEDGPYINASIQNGALSLVLMDKFKFYEFNETSLKMAYDITFGCSVGTRKLTVVYNIRDTNNHSPVFVPSGVFNYRIFLPLPMGYPISVDSDIVVRDVDLTNYGILSQIEGNPYFDLTYAEVDGSKKNHKLILSTKVGIKEISNVTNLFMIATDRDLSGYPPLSSFAQMAIVKEPESGCPVPTTTPAPAPFL